RGTDKTRLSQTYRRLVDATSRVAGQAKRFATEIALGVKQSAHPLKQAALLGLRQELESKVPLVRRVIRQTRARVFGGNTHVPDKLVSLFEPSTEIIRKGKAAKPTEFGKMLKLREAENQIIIDYEVYDRRPSDRDLLVPSLDAHLAVLTRPP